MANQLLTCIVSQSLQLLPVVAATRLKGLWAPVFQTGDGAGHRAPGHELTLKAKVSPKVGEGSVCRCTLVSCRLRLSGVQTSARRGQRSRLCPRRQSSACTMPTSSWTVMRGP